MSDDGAQSPLPDGASDGMTRRTLSALKWTYASALLGILPQIIYTTVMSRLLEPAAFGLVALAQVYLRFGAHFATMGLTQALIQKDEVGPRDIRAAFTATTGMGLVFSAAAALSASAFGDAFESPRVAPIVAVLGLTFVIDGAGRTALALLRRDLRFDALARIEVPSYALAYVGVGVGTAAMGAGVWSLVAAALAQSLIRTVAAVWTSRHPMRPLFSAAEFRALYAFGGRVSVISLLQFASKNLDVFFIGRGLGERRLGQYNRATYLVVVPFTQLVDGLAKVLFPAFSRVQSDIGRLRGAYLTSSELLTAVLLPTAAGIAVAAPELTKVVLGPGWSEAGRVLPVLAVLQAVGFVTSVDGLALEARGRLNAKIAIEVAVAAATAGGLGYLASRDAALLDYASAMLVVGVLRQVAYATATSRLLQIRVRDGLAPWLRSGVAALLVAGILGGAAELLRPRAHEVVVLLVEIALGALVLAFSATHGTLVHARHLVRQRLLSAGILDRGRAGDLARRVLAVGR